MPRAGLWVSADQLAALPTCGAAWAELEQIAEQPSGAADVSDQNSDHDTSTLAAALVAARLDSDAGRREVRDALVDSIGTEEGGRTLALGRNLPGYVIAADLIDLASFDPEADQEFRSWLAAVRTRELHGLTLISTHEQRPNNWGTHAGAARIAVAAYLGDRADLDRAATVFRGWLGDRDAYAGFVYGNPSWQADEDRPVGINPAGATIEGEDVDGVIPDDQRRSGGFRWPPPRENYVWEALQGTTVQAELLSRAGYDAWEWSDRALMRTMRWLHEPHFREGTTFAARGDDRWVPFLVNQAYGTDFPAAADGEPGKNMGWTGWTHAAQPPTCAS